MTRVLIIGGGHAAAQLITSFRQKKFEGDITLVTEENMIPYQRPPLSKAYLSGDLAAERLPILRDSAYEKMGVDVRLNAKVTAINSADKTASLADGETLSFDKLIIATGGRARELTCEGADLDGLHYIRTIGDIDTMQDRFDSAKNVVIIGGGYIGLEIAAVARKFGKSVTLLEAMPRILERVVAPKVSEFYEAVHRAEGVDIKTEQMVSRILGENGAVSGVETASGETYAADLIVAGIGLIANSELAADAGLDVSPMGINVNAFCQTNDPDIYAAGDVTWFHHPFYGREMRVESVQNAADQAKIVVAHICGEEEAYEAQPWFWSDQYGLKLQIAGLSQGYDDLVVRGSADERSIAFFYMKEGAIIAADCVNRVSEFMAAKKLIAAKIKVDPSVLSDESRPFKEIAKELLA